MTIAEPPDTFGPRAKRTLFSWLETHQRVPPDSATGVAGTTGRLGQWGVWGDWGGVEGWEQIWRLGISPAWHCLVGTSRKIGSDAATFTVSLQLEQLGAPLRYVTGALRPFAFAGIR